MDTPTLVDALRALDTSALEWKFALYSPQKSRDGIELIWNACKMRGTASWVEALIANTLEKTLDDRTVTDYSPFLDKEFIGAMPQEDDLIREPLVSTLMDIRNAADHAPEDFVSGVLPKVAGYGIYGCRRNENGDIAEQVLFMRRQNPFVTAAKARICTTEGDEIIAADKPVLKFMPTIDFLMINDGCYFISPAIEKDFELENRNIAIAARRLETIGKAEIVSDWEQLEKAAMVFKNARKFTDFDREILDHISGMTIVAREEFLSTYGITLDNNGLMDTSDSEQCELIIDLLCCRSCLDVFGRLAVGTGITPRE